MAAEAPLTFGVTVSLSATTATGRVAVNLPAAQQLVLTNLGPDLIYVKIGDVTVTAAVASSFPILPGTQIAVTAPSGTIYVAGITPTSTATLKVTSADGYLSGLGGGVSGSTGENVTIVGPVDANSNVKTVLYDGSGNVVAYNANGLATRANSAPVVIADFNSGEYETVAASQTAQVLGATGGTGDYISGLLVIPATTSPGQVLLLDNATSITVFTGGATSVSNLVPFFIALGMYSVSGAWKVTTGANVSVIGIGNFT